MSKSSLIILIVTSFLAVTAITFTGRIILALPIFLVGYLVSVLYRAFIVKDYTTPNEPNDENEVSIVSDFNENIEPKK